MASKSSNISALFVKSRKVTALDEWNSLHGFDNEFSPEDVAEYVKSIRDGRTNKEIVEW